MPVDGIETIVLAHIPMGLQDVSLGVKCCVERQADQIRRIGNIEYSIGWIQREQIQ